MTQPKVLPTHAAEPPSADPEKAFLQAQELFFDWTAVICGLVNERLLPLQPRLDELQVAYSAADPERYNISVYAKGIDFSEWRMDFHFVPTRAAGRPPTDEWRRAVEQAVLTALAPLRALLPALGVNEYLFEGMNDEVDGISLPIEPYEDSDLFEQLRYLFPAAARACLAAKEE